MLSNCWPTCKLAGDHLVDTVFEGVQEPSRLKITNELRWFIEVHNHEAVKIGEVDTTMGMHAMVNTRQLMLLTRT